ncbi:low affinity vacuolar monovalent cation/H(+) antiporter-like [Gigantopelta aegis]|uniref:low affinity vacuolar monovalent cation/H(+) antiporter-like n=1 Tax=Gigantopelta aegis TaxID=1735272 RepID=UPI001B8877D7|nr:low affinity vacuolar monovalent cation/H(+) antiporter-like [Gigantopelta aegis]
MSMSGGNIEYSGEHSAFTHSEKTAPRPIVNEIGIRNSLTRSLEEPRSKHEEHDTQLEHSYVMLPHPENDIEAHRISNNYLFGFKKWKSHVTSRPLSSRSEIVQDLYADINKVKPVKVTTTRPSNIIYLLLFGWWLALLYLLVSALMFLTYFGRAYGTFCWKMAKYFLWPFGKFVHQIHTVPLHAVAKSCENTTYTYQNGHDKVDESTSLIRQSTCTSQPEEVVTKSPSYGILKRPVTYLWFILGLPLLLIAHAVIWGISWMFVITIPIAKLNSKTITKILFLSPEKVDIVECSEMTLDSKMLHSEIIMFTHQSMNVYYYKYTVDGVNVFLVNLLVFVLLATVLEFVDKDNKMIGGAAKCILAVLAIIPLTYYIGMAITSISAQSSFAIGAILNATFGSIVEIILYVIVLKKNKDTGKDCFQELVKSSLTGTILVSILLIPGVCMVVGGIKHRTQIFNPRSASISAALLFVSVAGVFAPTLFAKIYGTLQCRHCEPISGNSTDADNVTRNTTAGFQCSSCQQSVFGLDGDKTLYNKHIEPLVYGCALVLPLAYIMGLVFTLKTHSSHVYGAFEEQQKAENSDGMHGAPQWSRIKSTIILLFCAVFIALSADTITDNIEPLVEASGVSELFVGVTMLSVIPELPEVVNGVQFALQNNVNLGIEIGSSTAIQVCLVQIPLLVLINLIYPMGLILVYQDVHFWAVIFSVIVINYIFQDGKSDYFQGSIVVLIYLVLMLMYFFTITPPEAKC